MTTLRYQKLYGDKRLLPEVLLPFVDKINNCARALYIAKLVLLHYKKNTNTKFIKEWEVKVSMYENKLLSARHEFEKRRNLI